MSPGLLLDLVSLGYAAIGAYTLWQLVRNWRSVWRRPPDADSLDRAWRAVLFVLWPLVVLVHEAGHALAARNVGATVRSFNWRVFWGYVVHSRPRDPLDVWWIALAGTVAAVAVGILALLAVPRLRRGFPRDVAYALGTWTVVASLVIYPLWSLVGMPGIRGDWLTIYDFARYPQAPAAVAAHAAVLLAVWGLARSRWMRRLMARTYPAREPPAEAGPVESGQGPGGAAP